MKIRRTLIQLTTTATLAASLLNASSGAFAARFASNSTGYSTDNATPSRVALQSSANSRLGDLAKKYEPDPNGNPRSDGTGTR
ncbi:MAG: hypothetical protein ACRC62_23980 [Microcoleus sp.]